MRHAGVGDDVLKLNENEVGLKQEKYFQKTSDGKQILRDMMTNHIARQSLDRRVLQLNQHSVGQKLTKLRTLAVACFL